MRDSTEDGTPPYPVRPLPTQSECTDADFDPTAPPRVVWLGAYGAEHEGAEWMERRREDESLAGAAMRGPGGPDRRRAAWMQSVFMGRVILLGCAATFLWIASNPSARYEIVHWATFHHARQAYEFLHSVGQGIRF